MKKIGILVLILILSLSSMSVLAYDYEYKYLWTQEFGDPKQVVENERFTNMRAIFEHCGNQERGFDVDAMIDSHVGEMLMDQMHAFILYPDPMGEDILNYWKNYEGGILKELHNPGPWETEWCTYVPLSAYEGENKDKLYPVVFLGHGGNDKKYSVECFGFVQHAAKTQEYIVVAPQDRSVEATAEIFDVLRENYPVDWSRIYMTGNSMGGIAAITNGIAYPDKVAAVAPFGIAPYIYGSIEERITAGKYKLPVMYLDGDLDGYANFPIGDTERGTAEEFCTQINQFYAINDITMAPLTPTRIAELVASDDDYMEKISGMEFTTTYEKEYPDTTYFFGTNYDDKGIPMYVLVLAEGGTHWQSASYAEIVWDFFCNFSRDVETGELIVHK